MFTFGGTCELVSNKCKTGNKMNVQLENFNSRQVNAYKYLKIDVRFSVGGKSIKNTEYRLLTLRKTRMKVRENLLC